MSVSGGQKRYVSTFRIQLSAPASRLRAGKAPPHGSITPITNRHNAANSEKSASEPKYRPSSCTFSQPTSPLLNNGCSSSPRTSVEDSDVFRSPQTTSPAHIKALRGKRRSSSGTGSSLQIVTPCEQVEVRLGDTARLGCVIQGTPPIVSCWIRNEKEVLKGCRHSVESDGESSTLVITEALREDAGRYTLFVRDHNNSAHKTLTLSVIEPPQPPASCPVACLLSSHSLDLSWSGVCYDGGSAITGYIVEVQQVGAEASGSWRELSPLCKSTSLTVDSGLEPDAKYCFRVRACNTVGLSEPSPESQLIHMSDSPAAPQEEKMSEYTTVTINTVNKVTDHYNVLERLGVGKFGEVKRLCHKETGRVCAGKFYRGRRTKERDAAKGEIELMNSLHHPKLVQCLAAYDNKPGIVMVMEFIAGGELFERIVDDDFEHTEQTCIGFMSQILQGVEYIHQQNIVHLDLKPENIVCEDRTSFQIKIIDFGLACRLDSTPVKVMQGTPEFMAPEVVNFEPVSPATDMWSIGVICYILLSGESPFLGDNDAETLNHVTAASWEFDEESFSDITNQAKEFIRSLLQEKPRRRMSCEKALAHFWMKAFDSTDHAPTKYLPKDKMRRFLNMQKWKKTAKAVQALNRMALLSKSESAGSPVEDTQQVLKTLEERMQSKPEFITTPSDLSVCETSTAQLFCQVSGYPDPEVLWLKDGEVLEEKEGCVQVDYEEDGMCVLTLEGVSLHQTGTYTCRAANVHGEVLCSANVSVVNKNH